MAEQELPKDAPVMPRYPTLIRGSIPKGGTQDDVTRSVDPAKPPPRFPSMPNVELSKAQAIASESVGRQWELEIAETIERDAVEPGTGQRRASAAASKQWSSMDQRRLNSLLQNVHTGEGAPPPEAGSTLSVPPLEVSAPAATPPPDVGDTRSLARGGNAFPSALATVPMTMFSAPGAEAEAQVEHFGGAVEDEDIDEKHGVMVRSKSQSAAVSITADFGLVGGHEGVVHDSVFFNSKTLVTAGADGKVCIWDLDEKYVRAQFSPYNGNAVQMLYPICEEDGSTTCSLITLSADRLLRVWNLVDDQAVLLRSMQIPPSNRDLVMSVPVLTPQMKTHAAAAAAAAAVTTTDLTAEEAAPASMDASQFPQMSGRLPAYRGIKAAEQERAIIEKENEGVVMKQEVEETPKRFSFNIFTKNKSKKALAS